jgi:5-methylcytosine-specific restriction endonuclease McrA
MRKTPRYPPHAEATARKAWGEAFTVCMLCGEPWFDGLQTHEIVRRSQAPYRWCHPTNFLRLCGSCHEDKFCNVTLAPYAVQAAVKKLRDPDNWDYEAFVEILGRGPQCVTPEEIELAVRAFQMVGF